MSLHLSRSQAPLGNPRTSEFDVPEYDIDSVVAKYDHDIVELDDLRAQVGSLTEEAGSYGDWLGGTGRNVRNYLEFLQLLAHSRKQIEQYSADAYIFVRPDLFPVDTFIPFPGVTLSTRKILTPRWGRWSGLNDRFAVVPQRYTKQYFSRIETVPEYLVAKGPLRPERHLKWALQKVPFSARLPFELVRVRTGATLEKTDLSRLRNGGRRRQRQLASLLELYPFKGQGLDDSAGVTGDLS